MRSSTRSWHLKAHGHRHRIRPFHPTKRGLNTSNRSFTRRAKMFQKLRDSCRCTVEHCNVFCAVMGSTKMQRNDKNVADQAPEQGPTIYFDGSCALCSVEIDHYASRAGADKLDFVDVSRSGAQLGADLTSDTAMRRFHVRRSNGSLVSGALAFVEVWDTLPGWHWAARVAKIRGVLPMLEIGYRAFLPIRPLISKAVGYFRLGAHNQNNTIAASAIAERNNSGHLSKWSCRAYVPTSQLLYAAFRSKAKGLLPPSDEWRRRGL